MIKGVEPEECIFVGGPVNGMVYTIPSATPVMWIPIKNKPPTIIFKEEIPEDINYSEHMYRRYNQSDCFGRKTSFFATDETDITEFLSNWEFINTLVSFFAGNVV